MTTATEMTAGQTADYVNPLIAASRTVFETMLAQLRQQMVYRPGFLGVGGRKSSLHFVVNL